MGKDKKYLTHLSENDKVLKRLISVHPKFNLKHNPNYFETLVSSIIAQQLSGKVADVIFHRFKDLYNVKKRPLWNEATEKLHFPFPEEILKTSDQTLRNIGLSWAKAKYVKDLSQKVLDKEVVLDAIHKKSDEEITNELIKVKGIGVWSAKMFLIFSLARLNVLPYEDLGIRRAVMLQYKLRKMPEGERVMEIAKKNNWYPYCTVASWYLWRSIDGG